MQSSITFTLTRLTESRLSGCDATAGLAVNAFVSDGVFGAAPAPSTRRLEFVGDSITAGDLNDGAGSNICANAPWNDDITLSTGGQVRVYFSSRSSPHFLPLHLPVVLTAVVLAGCVGWLWRGLYVHGVGRYPAGCLWLGNVHIVPLCLWRLRLECVRTMGFPIIPCGCRRDQPGHKRPPFTTSARVASSLRYVRQICCFPLR